MLFHVDARIVPGADLEPYLAEEVEAVQALRTRGFVEQLLRRQDGSGAYLLVSAASLEVAQETMDRLPFPQHGLMAMHVEPVERL